MGSLSAIDLPAIIAAHGVRYLVEFGTGDGEDAAYAAGLPFDHIYSIEASHRQAIQAAFRHSSNLRMTFIHGKGERAWRQVAPEIPAEQPVMFLLDGAPFEQDLAAIARHRDISRDIFLVEGGDPVQLDRLLGATHRQRLPVDGMLQAFPVDGGC
jgi:hypothetical protein